MGDLSEEGSLGPSRRALLLGTGTALGTALAGCTSFGDDGDQDAQAKIQELEARVAELRDENVALNERVAEYERELATYQRRLDTLNLWGFDEETMQRLQELAYIWSDSIVVIDAIVNDRLWSVGTGWVYDEGVIATNAHVIAPRKLPDDLHPPRYRVWDRTGAKVDGQLLGYTYGHDEVFEQQEDIGFLGVPDSITDGRGMDHGVSRDLSIDEPLVQIGHPYSLEFWTPSVGPFIAHREPFFATNVPGRPGVSGSPVLDLDGDVVGMTWGGQYIRVPQRQADDAPLPGDGQIHPAFEEAINGMHSYMHRIHTAADVLV